MISILTSRPWQCGGGGGGPCQGVMKQRQGGGDRRHRQLPPTQPRVPTFLNPHVLQAVIRRLLLRRAPAAAVQARALV